MAAEDVGSSVEVGWLNECEPWKLESRFFPSKVGGKPAWLDLKNISVDLSCRHCSKPCVFLCQVYTPQDEPDTRDFAHHRMIFVFVCGDPACSKPNDNGNFVVYRCQLGRINEFYSPDDVAVPSPVWCSDARVEKHVAVCIVCGAFAPSQCGKCKVAKYCSRHHQTVDWASGHGKKCGTEESNVSSAKVLFPEFEIVSESEILDEKDLERLKEPEERSEKERMKDYADYVSKHNDGTMRDVDPKLLQDLALAKDDKYFRKFKERLKICEDQVLRYEKGGEPLWITKPNLDPKDVPPCEHCHAPRQFEFEILPTLLNSLQVDSLGQSIDWGVLLIYTCRSSCNGGASYKREFLWKQDLL